jgi:hypothetical protein
MEMSISARRHVLRSSSDALCTTEKTNDLLDCDCGGLTQWMKVAILDLRDAHTAHMETLVDRGEKGDWNAVTDEVRAEWLVLHQARNGAVARRDDGYFNAGSSIAGSLVQVYDRLVGQELLVLREPSAGGYQRVAITSSGRARYEALLTRGRGELVTGGDSPDVARAKQLVDELRAQGFEFVRTAPGLDGPLMGRRLGAEWVDFVYVEGFSHDCIAWRQRRSPLVVPGQGLVERRVTGGALTVLAEALSWGSES